MSTSEHMTEQTGAVGHPEAEPPSQERRPHPIEERSFEILRSRVDLSPMPPLWRAVAERVIHASADLEYAVDLVTDESHLRRGLAALRAGAPVVVDAEMVAAGITARRTLCMIGDPAAARMARAAGITRAAAAIRLAYAEVGPGAVWVVGCAPTALEEIIKLNVRPALVIGLPVGFVGAAEAKQALRDSGLPQLSNVSEKGGSAVAAAALNALLYYQA
ncbi:precorrin-8X methylmutase [Thermomonospora curvata]|uniref:Precorrin-8X methylmutase CbiC/CobH n=1 Tax=Thermomonospora curvata (strain ATCC 19995 / DSM 43183 / JCM 3096 / KCTC 9072 / NBRC 15933 / NCIMB 10081 / Henssen B9) TaxID=471852 RepID=D1A9W6_THECD|nr:precorrin-8X methylmutase [Thermomonospora curvata]ACY96902.1 Precorrin-8X methylmutase CbiC/CobH [Thermomonospora curvata DSM 43183]